MEIYDIIMLVIIVGAALFGAIKGFAWQLASIASILVSYLVAFKFREPFSQSIQAAPPWNRFLAMLILFIGTSLVIWVGFRMLSNTIDRLKLGEFDRQVGFVFGGIKGFLYCTLVTLFAVTLMGQSIRGNIVASKSGRFISEVLDRSDSVIPAEIHVVIRPYLDRFDERFAETQNSLNSGRETGFAPNGNLSGNQPAGGSFSWPSMTSAKPSPRSQPSTGQLPDAFWNQNTGGTQQAPFPVNTPNQRQPSGQPWGTTQGYQQAQQPAASGNYQSRPRGF